MLDESSELEAVLFRRLRDGDGGAVDELIRLVYQDLHRLAHARVRGQADAFTLQTTALVHEVFIKMFPGGPVEIQDRQHFMLLAARSMRSVLVDHARSRGRVKRTPTGERVDIEDVTECFEARSGDLIALDEALRRLESMDPTAARVVELRFFGDLSVREVADVLGVSTRTVERDWQAARALLRKELE